MNAASNKAKAKAMSNKAKPKYYLNPLKVKKTKKEKIIRAKGGKWKPGHSGNPTGLRKGERPELTLSELVAAIRTEEKKHRKTLLAHLVERAYKSDAALGVLLKKLLPDLKAMEALIGRIDGQMSTEDAETIRQKLKDRFELSQLKSNTNQETT